MFTMNYFSATVSCHSALEKIKCQSSQSSCSENCDRTPKLIFKWFQPDWCVQVGARFCC